MPRRRTLTIIESDAELEALEQSATTPDIARRLSALRHIRRHPELTIEHVAIDLSCGLRSLNRWLAIYQRTGIAGLLKPSSNESPVTSEIEKEIHKLVSETDTRSPAAIQTWLHERYDHVASIATVRRLIRSSPDPRSTEKSMAIDRKQVNPAPSGSDWIVEFASSLPPLLSCTEWIEMFRTSLADYLEGVDRISVDVNVRCLDNTRKTTLKADLITHHVTTSARQRTRTAISQRSDSTRFKDQIEEMRAGGFPLDQYHAPYCKQYRLGTNVYLGTIILWNSIDKPPLHADTIQRLESLESGIIFLMSDCAARHQYTQPATQSFYPNLSELVEAAKLTKKERHVIALRLLGHSYKQIADTLKISIQTVGRHISNIHHKTETQGKGDLLATYFTPRRT